MGEYSYIPGQKTLLFNVGIVPKDDIVQVTYEAVVKSDAGVTSNCPKCENRAHVDYFTSPGSPASLDLHTGSIFYRQQH